MKTGSVPPIEMGSPVVAVARPVATGLAPSPGEDARLITGWRNRHRAAFLTEFEADPDRTETWLRDVVEPDGTRLLFMLEDPRGRAFGHLGLTDIDLEHGRAELDSVVRGEHAERGVMATCVTGLARWAAAELGVTDLFLRVRSDNPAVGFYERIGFSCIRRTSIRPMADGDEVRWVEDGQAAGVLDVIYMDYQWPAEEGGRFGRSQIAP